MAEEELIESALDINLDVTPVKRKIGEEEWSNAFEELAKEWGDSASKASIEHSKAGKAFKTKHVAVGLPAVLIPIIMAPISTGLSDVEGVQYINMVGFLVSGCLSATYAFFGFDKKHQQHMDFASRYMDVYTDVKYELVKSRSFRVAPDQFLLRIQMKMDSLGGSAPDL